jgi:hypothetical protein
MGRWLCACGPTFLKRFTRGSRRVRMAMHGRETPLVFTLNVLGAEVDGDESPFLGRVLHNSVPLCTVSSHF